jgi:hypothetical protein
MIRPGSIYLVWGPSGGLYWKYAKTPRGRYWRLCLWWVAIVWLPLDLDEIVLVGIKRKNEEGKVELALKIHAAQAALWDAWHRKGYDQLHNELAEREEETGGQNG